MPLLLARKVTIRSVRVVGAEADQEQAQRLQRLHACRETLVVPFLEVLDLLDAVPVARSLRYVLRQCVQLHAVEIGSVVDDLRHRVAMRECRASTRTPTSLPSLSTPSRSSGPPSVGVCLPTSVRPGISRPGFLTSVSSKRPLGVHLPFGLQLLDLGRIVDRPYFDFVHDKPLGGLSLVAV